MRAFAFVVLLTCAGAAAAQTAAAPPFPRPDIKEWTLPNGLHVAYLGVHRSPIVTVQVWYHVGSKDEPRNQRGAAHMFEHMMFKGTKYVPPEMYGRYLEGIGATWNAFTREDVTGYHETVPKQYLDFAVKLEAERMRNLVIRKEMVATEREVVKEELRTRIESSPVVKGLARFRSIAFTKHPYSWLPAGVKEDLDRLKVADLQKFYDLYYQPGNASLIVVGDVSEDEVRAAAERWFGPLARAPEPPRPARDAVEPKQAANREETVGSAQVGVIIGGYHGPPARSPDVYPLQVLVNVLSAGDSSRLHQRVVRRDRVGVAAGGDLGVFEDPGLFVLFGVYLTPEQGAKVKDALLAEIARVQRDAVGGEELRKAKNQITARYLFGLETVEGLAAQIGNSRMLVGDAKAWIEDYDKYQAVTVDDIQRVARTYLAPENLTVVVVPPAAAAKPGAAAGGGR